MAIASPQVSMAPMTVTMMNGTSAPKNRASNDRSRPGHPVPGKPNQAASSTGVAFSIPAGATAAVPTMMPISGAHRRLAPRAKRDTRVMAAKAAKATSGPLMVPGSTPAGTPANRSVVMGNTLTASSMTTVPPTVGVISRRKNDSRAENRNWMSDEATTRVPTRDSPPTATATVDTPMNAPDVPI